MYSLLAVWADSISACLLSFATFISVPIAVAAIIAPVTITRNGFDTNIPFNAAPNPLTAPVVVVEAVPTAVIPRAALAASSDMSGKACFNKRNLSIGRSIDFNI